MAEFIEFDCHPIALELRKEASSLIRELEREKYTPRALYWGQRQIIKRLQSIENVVRLCRTRQAQLQKEIKGHVSDVKLSGTPLTDRTKETIKQLQLETESLEFDISILRYSRWLFRYIADGIAWRSYNFRRDIILALGEKEPVPFSSSRDGFNEEIKIFRAIRKRGRSWLPLMHDITNCLRTGDYSIFHKGHLVRIIELKIRKSPSSEKRKKFPRQTKGREDRQIDRLDRIFTFLRTNNLADLQPNIQGKSIQSNVPEKHNFEAISKVMKAARKQGYGFLEAERGLLYLAWRMESTTVDILLENARSAYPHIFRSKLTFRSVNPVSEQRHLSLPITAMDLPARDIIDLLFDRIALIVMINHKCLEDYCAEQNIPLVIESNPEQSFQIQLKTLPSEGIVGESLWDRLFFEGLSLRSFCDLIKAIMQDQGLTINR